MNSIHYKTLAFVISPNGIARRKVLRIINRQREHTFLVYLFSDGDCYYELILDDDGHPRHLREEINDTFFYELVRFTSPRGTPVIASADRITGNAAVYYPDMQGDNKFAGQPVKTVAEKTIRLWQLAIDKTQEAMSDPEVRFAIRILPLPVANEIWHHYRTV